MGTKTFFFNPLAAVLKKKSRLVAAELKFSRSFSLADEAILEEKQWKNETNMCVYKQKIRMSLISCEKCHRFTLANDRITD